MSGPDLPMRLTEASEAFVAASRALSSPLPPSEVVRRATREIVRALGADFGSAWRLSVTGDQLLPLAGYHIPKPLDPTVFARPQPVLIGHPLVELLGSQQGPQYAIHSRDDPRFDYPLLRLVSHTSLLVQPMRVGRTMLGVFVVVWTRAPHRFRRRELRLVELVAKQTAVAVEKATLFASLCTLNDFLEALLEERTVALRRADKNLRASRNALRSLSRHLQKVREAERTRIAREIHDELGQALTGLTIALQRLGSVDGGDLAEQTRALVRNVDGIMQSVRRIASELRPSILDDLGLLAALDWQVREFETQTGIRTRLRCVGEPPALDAERATAVFRIIQEALTNVVRHAEATEVLVTLRVRAASLHLEIRDNGRGLAGPVGPARPHLGLLGMQERASALGGRLMLRNTLGRGTAIRLRMPVTTPRALVPARSLDGAGRRPAVAGTKSNMRNRSSLHSLNP